MTAAQIVEFLEASFGAFQQARGAGPAWRWDRGHLERNLEALTSAGLLEADGEERYGLTSLGALCGETGTEVVSVLRVASCLRNVPAGQVTDPELLALAQLTEEADGVRMPFNKKSVKSHHAEPVAWFGELANQGISRVTLSAFRFALTEPGQDVMRAKRTVACLLCPRIRHAADRGGPDPVQRREGWDCGTRPPDDGQDVRRAADGGKDRDADPPRS